MRLHQPSHPSSPGSTQRVSRTLRSVPPGLRACRRSLAAGSRTGATIPHVSRPGHRRSPWPGARRTPRDPGLWSFVVSLSGSHEVPETADPSFGDRPGPGVVQSERLQGRRSTCGASWLTSGARLRTGHLREEELELWCAGH